MCSGATPSSPSQGARLLPLLKLSLHENLTLSRAAAEAEATAAAALTAASSVPEREAGVAPPAAPPSEAGSAKSTAGTAPSPTPARAAPLSPATPAAADGGLREPPQHVPQVAQQAQQAQFSLDDLLGLDWEQPPEQPQVSCCCDAVIVCTALLGGLWFRARQSPVPLHCV